MGERVNWSAKLRTPFAVLGLETDGRAITRLSFLPLAERAQAPADGVSERALRELERYLDDPAFRFTVPLAPGGTAFQQRVWDALPAIPAGESRTYGEVARMVRSAPRAVGQACGANRIALIVPCHRVVGAMGAMGGFMGVGAAGPSRGAGPLRGNRREAPLGGTMTEDSPIAIKRWLLMHEGYRFGRD
ncbi:MAG: methylated-DNA--[protein]-cysteine S-methyltransferase [Burkholderiales bacterium]